MEQKIEGAANRVVFNVDEKVVPRPVVLQTAYRFIERCYVQLAREKGKKIRVHLKGKKKLSRRRLEQLAGEFENELLHQLVRHQVAEQTDKLREVLVGRALLSAEPQLAAAEAPVESEEMDYLEDPLGIAVPWEEKYGDQEEDK